jgi:hypothetical protein
MKTRVPLGAVLNTFVALATEMRTHPWLAGQYGTERLPWMAYPPLRK